MRTLDLTQRSCCLRSHPSLNLSMPLLAKCLATTLALIVSTVVVLAATSSDNLETADNLKKQADTAYSAGRFTDSEQLYTKALKILQETLGSDDIKTTIVLRLVGDTYQAQGRYIEAEATYKRAEKIFEKNSTEQSAYTLLNLTGLYMQQCRLTEAAESIARTVDIVEGTDWHVVNAGFASALGSQLVTLADIYYVGRLSSDLQSFAARLSAILRKVGGGGAKATLLPLRRQCESEGRGDQIEEFIRRGVFSPPRK